MTRPTMILSGGGGGGDALGRSLRALTLGTLQAYSARQADYDANGLGEVDQQFQIDVSGTATTESKWQELDVIFDSPFVQSPYEDRQEALPFEMPLFTYGVVVTKGSRLVVICNVIQWHADGDYVGGAKLEVGVFRPAGGGGVGEFKAQLHLNFEGWGGTNPPEPDADSDGEAT